MAFQLDPRRVTRLRPLRVRPLSSPDMPTSTAPATAPRPTIPLGDPTGGANARAWTEAVDGPARYPRVHFERSAQITMSDGVRLRATVIRPANSLGIPTSKALPTVVNINPYNRVTLESIDAVIHAPVLGPALHRASAQVRLDGTPLSGLTDFTRVLSGGIFDAFGINRKLVQSGYTQVIVDVRGTGASHGRWEVLGPREQQDSVEILEWIAHHSWCNGRIGLGGWSYSAINALQAADKRPAHLQAVFAVEGCEDIVRDFFATGGAPSVFVPLWLALGNCLKWIPNVATPVRDSVRGNYIHWFTSRLASPFTEMGSLIWGFVTGNDPRLYDDPFFDARNPRIESIEVPTFLFGGWHDIFARSTPRMYDRLRIEPGRKQMLVADGYHVDHGAGFGQPFAPPRIDVLERAWFDRWLKDIDNGIDQYGPVTMQQQGAGWTSGNQYPRPDVETRRLYFGVATSGTARHAKFDGSLGSVPSRAARRLGLRPGLRGVMSRDMTQATAGVGMVLGKRFTRDARFQEADGLSFTTEPALEPTQISGNLNLHLRGTGNGNDAFWAVTLNDVAPDGTSTVLTNGSLLASLRAIDPERSRYDEDGELLMAHHPQTDKSRLPVRPGYPLDLDIELVATDALLETGHRLRVDVYAASFPRFLHILPDMVRTQLRRQQVVLDPARPSYLTLQMAGNPGW